MKIEHVAMYVNDLEGAKDFFVRFFEAKVGEKYDNQEVDFHSYFLTFEDGARLELMNIAGMADDAKKMARTGYIHLAFSVGSKEKVDQLTKQIKEEGYEILSEPRMTGDGYYESCIMGIEGNQIEITL